ncbi:MULTISPECIES: 4-(cytidine 5'-diphospho)-2-C-methyl-D-erythritol kinase [unclassified Helicobacter]|uniref:4-(cytidine 5'-diphospho)-2-C-methyl-D-erythritol kinase n=1 Tax=unclassified Helicobacter TaxID=2593540 RepID=UPI000CF1C486|nr:MULTISPECIES: 4-(cytidine 5'-diphospho)-2-C-methyl-D-erythritol kinase [unclassified Helicobacter]
MLIFDVFPKINIFLKIIGVDERGYHLLDSRFHLVRGGLKDTIFIKPSSFFSLKGDFGCQLHQNTIYLAVVEMKKFLESKGRKATILDNIAIEVEKNIPRGGGLGGGSADAGGVLFHLNQKFFNLTSQELCEIGKKVGADVPFFVTQYMSANVYGIGEQVEYFEEEILDFEIFVPEISCNTKMVYSEYDRKPIKTLLSYEYQKFSKMPSKDILKIYDRKQLNDLLYPALNIYPELKNFERDLGDEWFFSGSGSSFFRLRK